MRDIPIIPRHLLAKHFAGDERMIAAFEDLNAGASETQASTLSTVASTDALQDATVIVLSANQAFTNERILKLAPGLVATDDGTYVTIKLDRVARVDNFGVTFVAPGEATIFLPLAGTAVTRETAETLYNKTLDKPFLASLGNYASDAAAATGGVAIGQIYRNGSAVQVRVT